MYLGWVLAIILAVFLYEARKDLRMLRGRFAAQASGKEAGEEATGKQQRALTAAFALVILRLQLKRMREGGELEEGDFLALTAHIDACWSSDAQGAKPPEDSALWWSACETGWNILTARGLVPHGPPPWPGRTLAPGPHEAAVPAQIAPAVEEPEGVPSSQARPSSPEKTVAAAKARPQTTSPVTDAWTAAMPGDATTARPQAGPAAAPQRPAAVAKAAVSARDHAWRPAAPGPVERALRVVSGWPKVLVPFLVQNIGWFIGGFLFLAGSVFLVSYTTGFVKATIVLASLFAYTVFLVWAGYKLLQARPRLTTPSAVLLSTGLLLVPLTISAATRLMMNAGDKGLLWIIAIFAAASSLVVFYVTAQVVSGVVHRSLRGDYPRLFLAIAALQLAAPLVAFRPTWPLLAVLHLLLLGLLAYGLLRFVHEWLQSIFVDRKKIAYFAAGSLLYAALASFIHLTWGVRAVSVPAGYYAPYLMAVSALLFYLDAQFKAHAHRHTFLSRFTFFVYGLSVVAILLALNAPVARLITLGMAAALYGMVLAKYLTLIPLYMMLASLGGLYAFGILAHLPASTHFLAAVPGLYGLVMLSRWATKRGADKPLDEVSSLRRVGLVTYRIVLVILAGLALWSLANSAPGPLAMTTGLAVTAALWWLLRAAPGPVIPARGQAQPISAPPMPLNLLEGPWLYAPIAAAIVTMAFLPRLGGLSWPGQLSLALMLLSTLWAALLILGRRPHARRLPAQGEVYANSALLCLMAGTALAALGMVAQLGISGLTILILAAGAGVLLSLSLNLYITWLFYAFLLWGAATAAAVKLSYFPQRSVGLVEMLGVAGLWVLLWWLDRRPDELSGIGRRRAWRDAPQRLLWLLPCAAQVPEAPVVDGSGPPTPAPDAATGAPDGEVKARV